MRSPRGLLSIGIGFLMVAGLSLLTGPSEFPWIYLAALLIGTALLVAGLVLSRREPEPSPELAPDPARGERLVRLAAATMAVLGVAALVVALLVPEDEAQAHATGHLVTGLVCAGLFAALAFPWHPRPGTGTAMVRGIVLSLLAAAAIGGFAESLGGSGYDAANEGHRIVVLTTLHNLVTPFGALTIGAVPIGLATGLVVLVTWIVRRNRAELA
jgi:hypothetical protein